MPCLENYMCALLSIFAYALVSIFGMNPYVNL
jgi:hypothetical protein